MYIITKYLDFITEGKAKKDTFSSINEREYWGSVGAGIFPICLETKRALISLRSPYVYEPNTYGVWGGKLDDDEDESDIKNVALREFQEETGYGSNIKLIPSYVFVSKDGDFKYHNFIGLLEEEFIPSLDWETADFKWITFEELQKLKPKHFGLMLLLKNDLSTIKKYMI